MRLGITGHQAIPADGLRHVRDGVAAAVAAAQPPLVGVTSLAAGADQLFAGLVLDHGGQLHVIVPCRHYEQAFDTSDDAARFAALLRRAQTVEHLPYPEPSEDAFYAAGRRMVDLSDAVIAVWDGEPARGAGGTADIVRYAHERGIDVQVIWPAGLTRAARGKEQR
jgi:hypothetical protein